ncbi:tetraspanin-19-like [Cornus florida]|uniref:tetraspanin-19-like n=1 Tax=Cornus florida TaxID=4283 RepID=UPI00289B68F8|nr:tetraspanin-19-like [Cornus florida]
MHQNSISGQHLKMVRVVKNCLQFSLKLVNSTIGFVGIAMILYSLWMIRVWQRDMEVSSVYEYSSKFPWFIHAFLGIGFTLCAITFLGHIAADTANNHCLSCYISIIFLLLLLETAILADVILNSDWEKDLPEDPSGRFDDFKHFVDSNFDICRWIGLLIVLAQGLSILLATVLRTLETNQANDYDSDDGFAPPRLPLLNRHAHPLPYFVGDPNFASKNEAWKTNK